MKRSIFHGEGYLLSDNRASGGRKVEHSLVGCSHCQKLMHKPDWKEDGGFCHSCDAPVCGPCADRIPTKGCEVFLRALETELMAKYRRDQNRRLMGLE